MYRFIIKPNNFLTKPVRAYFNCYYIGYKKEGNPDYINTLKNTFDKEKIANLNNAKNKIKDILIDDIPRVLKDCCLQSCVLTVIPRAKEKKSYLKTQQFFIDAVSEAASELENVINGTTCIERHTDTKTTHLKEDTGRKAVTGNIPENNGKSPYPGITKDTCKINIDLVKDKVIILVDDVYTKNVNIDEDAIQALYDCGAKKVVFYSIAKTKKSVVK